jgi:hypothetical protein
MEGRAVACACAAALTCAASAARAQEPNADPAATARTAEAAAARERARDHTLLELSTGFLLLPAAVVCPTSLDPATCKRGEFSLAFGLQSMYRYHAFGFGGGIQWATTLRSDAATGDPSLGRQHTRSYFLVEAEARYYFLTSKSWRGWTGATVGVIVVNDSWSVTSDRMPPTDTDFVGPRADTLGTEGLTLGAGIGGEWSFLTNWSLSPAFRYSNWILPSTRQMLPTLDVASLSGRLDVFDVGIRVAYRIPL